MPQTDPAKLSDADYRRWERVGWLRTMASAFQSAHDWDADEDPDATAEMIREAKALADELEAEKIDDEQTIVEVVAPAAALVDNLRVGGILVIDPTKPILLQPGDRLRVIVDRPGWGKPDERK